MVIIEFKKLFFSKSTFLILLLLTFIASLSFYESHLNYQEFVQMEQSKDEDINLSAVKQFLHENKALSYLFRFIFQSEYYQLFVMALFAFIGIHLSAEPLKRLNSGYGNLIMTRTQYCAFYRDLLIAQSVYLTILLFLHFFCILVLALALNSFEMGIGFFQGSSFGPVANRFSADFGCALYLLEPSCQYPHVRIISIDSKYLYSSGNPACRLSLTPADYWKYHRKPLPKPSLFLFGNHPI